MRKNLYEILKENNFCLLDEYKRIYSLYFDDWNESEWERNSISDYVDELFDSMDKKITRRCLDIDDFNSTYNLLFPSPQSIREQEVTLELFLTFSEYVMTFVNQCLNIRYFEGTVFERIKKQIYDCMEEIGYMELINDGISIFVNKKPEALAVAELVPSSLSYSVLEYNHHALKGDIEKKRVILKMMADDYEPQKRELNKIDGKFASNLSRLMNSFIRHDTSENQYILGLTSERLEEIYDDIYQMWLLAKLRLDDSDREKRVTGIIREMSGI